MVVDLHAHCQGVLDGNGPIPGVAPQASLYVVRLAGDQVRVTGRNADGSWLQVKAPRDFAGRVWIYGPLTNIDAATVQTLVEVPAVEIEVATPPGPEPNPAPEPVAEPEPAPVVEPESELTAATLPDLSDCEQWHTVNANEIRLEQIANWYQLDLPA